MPHASSLGEQAQALRRGDAEAGHGVAVIPSILRADRTVLRVRHVTHRGEPVGISLAVLWDKRRMLPRHGERFAELLAGHIRELFPIARAARIACGEPSSPLPVPLPGR